MTNATAPKTTAAYLVQAGLAFAVALVTMIVGELYLPVPPWTRAFLALGTVFLVSSAFTLAKCVRDQQETGSVLNRIDQARLDRLLAEFDPFQVTPFGQTTGQTGSQAVPQAQPAPMATYPAYPPVPSYDRAG